MVAQAVQSSNFSRNVTQTVSLRRFAKSFKSVAVNIPQTNSLRYVKGYSQRKASIGSSRAAFHAGHKPKTIPTAAEIPTPAPIAHKGTKAGSGEYLFTMNESNSPTPSPTSP